MDNQKPIRVAIYTRVSTEEQAVEGYSLEEQQLLIRERCQQMNYAVAAVYEDAGISGKDIKHRPAMQQLLEDAAGKKFDMVMSWKINRISRRLSDAIKIVDILEKYGISYQSYSEPFDSSTPAGKMQFQMMALIGEFERNTIAQNVKMGMLAKAKSGEWCGGIPPLGYYWKEVKENENRTRKKSCLAVQEQEAEVVRKIYTLYASGKGYKAIVNQLNKEGDKTKLGNAFSVAQLRAILTNPVYIGKVRYDVRRDWNEKRRNNINPNPVIVEGKHPAIVEQELWEQVQFMISQKQGKPSRIYDGEYPLTGILKCPVCGAGMVISRVTCRMKDGSKKRIAYYACGNWKNKGTAVCHSNMVRVEKANAFVYSQLERLLNDEAFFREVVNREHRILKENAEREKNMYERELEKLKVRQQKNHELYEDGAISREEFSNRREELNLRQENLRHKQAKALTAFFNERRKEIPKEVIREILKNFSKILFSDIDRTIRKRLLHLLISEITIDESRNIDSIKLKLSDELIMFLQNHGGTPTDGAPSVFMFRDFGIQTCELELVI